MRLSLRGEYALRALVALGEDYSDGVVPIHVISRRQDIPKRFLEQILNDLRSGGFVESKRGIAGGYRLARDPEEIPLAAVLRHLGGSIEPDAEERRARLRASAAGAQGAIRSVMREVRNAVAQVLEQVTLADLCRRAREWRDDKASALDYAI
jgi:Rrf2 family protein